MTACPPPAKLYESVALKEGPLQENTAAEKGCNLKLVGLMPLSQKLLEDKTLDQL